MKKIMLGLVAAAALVSFVAPAFADDAPPAGDTAPKKDKKSKKSKGDAKTGDAAGADAAKK